MSVGQISEIRENHIESKILIIYSFAFDIMMNYFVETSRKYIRVQQGDLNVIVT